MRWSAEIGAGAIRNPVPVSDRQVLEAGLAHADTAFEPDAPCTTGRGSMAECLLPESANPEMPALMYA